MACLARLAHRTLTAPVQLQTVYVLVGRAPVTRSLHKLLQAATHVSIVSENSFSDTLLVAHFMPPMRVLSQRTVLVTHY